MNKTYSSKIHSAAKIPTMSHIFPFMLAVSLLVFMSATVFVSLSSLLKNSSGGSSIVPPNSEGENVITEHIKEVRGIYIATVYNINYPSRQGLSEDKLRLELDDIVNTCANANLNTVYFQVRPSADALYKSDIFPVSEYISGTQGDALPGDFDPLQYLIDAAHEKDISVHAWVNPLRVTVGSAAVPKHDVGILADNHPARKNPQYTVPYSDGRLYFDCGMPEVRELIAMGVAEIAANYDIDGIIFDDYFYPSPVYCEDGTLAKFDDSRSYAVYGGNVPIDDWRRENVNQMIKSCYDAIKSVDKDCEFGVAPFGIWQNDNGTNGGSATHGLESYSAIYCDPTAWIKGGYIDYIAPQLYWRFTTPAAPYDVLVNWWSNIVDRTDVELIISHGVYNYDTWSAPENELRAQVEFARAEPTYRGSILYGYEALKNNSSGLLDETREVFSENIVYTSALPN